MMVTKDDMEPPISVVVPTLNSAATLDMTLLSLCTQRNCNVKIFVVDSGSTDGTLDICSRWGVKAHYVPPGNMYRAINQGLKLCDTPWFMYLNSDDFLYPQSLARLLSAGDSQGADVVYGVCDYVDSEGRFLHSFTPAPPTHLLSLFRCGFFGFAQQTTIFRKAVFESLGGFNERYSLSADADFYLRALVLGSSFIRVSEAPVACFRLGQSQLSRVRAQEMQEQIRSLVKQSAGLPAFSDWMKLALLRVHNSPQYLIRILRGFFMSHRFRIPKTMDCDYE
jgi:glycosyltransferase involved in cell wall biosynthesis